MHAHVNADTHGCVHACTRDFQRIPLFSSCAFRRIISHGIEFIGCIKIRPQIRKNMHWWKKMFYFIWRTSQEITSRDPNITINSQLPLQILYHSPSQLNHCRSSFVKCCKRRNTLYNISRILAVAKFACIGPTWYHRLERETFSNAWQPRGKSIVKCRKGRMIRCTVFPEPWWKVCLPWFNLISCDVHGPGNSSQGFNMSCHVIQLRSSWL